MSRQNLIQYEAIMSSTTDMMALIDTNYIYLTANNAYAEAFNKKDEEIIGYSVSDVLGREFFENIIRPHAERCFTGRQVNYQTEFNFPKHGRRYMDVNYYPYYDNNKQVKGFVVNSRDITKQKKLEDEYSTVLKYSSDGFVVVDAKGNFVETNEAMCKMFDYTHEEFLKLGVLDIDMNQNMNLLPAHIKNIMTKGSERFETLGRKKDGTAFPVEISANYSQRHGHFYVFLRDKTLTNIADKRLKKSEQFLDVVFSSIQDGISVLDKNLRIQKVNPIMELWHKEKMPLVGKKCHLCYHGTDKICKPCPTVRAFKSGATEHDIVRGLPGSPIKWMELFTYPMKDEDTGEITGVVEFVRDITDRRQAEVKLKEESEFRELILSEAPVGISIYDIETGQCITANKTIAALIGATLEQVLAQNFYKIESWKKSGLLKAANKAIKENSKEQISINVTTTFGKEISFESYLTPFSAGEKRYLLFTLTDFTEHKQLQEHLFQSEKLRAIGQLAGGIAHDFNNQLAGIQSFTEIIKSQVKDKKELVAFSDSILTSVKRASDLTSQLLAYSRKGKYQLVEVDIHTIIREVISILKHSIDKRIEIKQQLYAEPPTTTGDPSQLQNAVLNLALNASDAIQGRGRLTFETCIVKLTKQQIKSRRLEIESGEYIQVLVEDTGKGMDPETLKHIFEPFFTTKDVGQGTGMGLAAVYGTVQNHNGCVKAASKPGKGTSITTYLPLVRKKSAPAKPSKTKTLPKKTHANILFADDEPMMINTANLILEGIGHQVTTCKDGKEAVNYYKIHWKEIDLVMLDMHMPKLNGKEAFLEMKKLNPDIKAMLLSGYNTDAETKSALDLGIKGFIQKPFNQEEFFAAINKVL